MNMGHNQGIMQTIATPPLLLFLERREGGGVRLLILSGLGGGWGVAINCWAKEGGRGEAINSFSPLGGVSLKIVTSQKKTALRVK